MKEAAGRAALVALLVCPAFIVALLFALYGSLPIDLVVPRGVEVYEHVDDGSSSGLGDLLGLLAFLAVFAALMAALGAGFGAAARAYTRLPRGRGVRLLAGAVALAPLAIATLLSIEAGEAIRAVAGGLATAWLWLALRRARDECAAPSAEPESALATS